MNKPNLNTSNVNTSDLNESLLPVLVIRPATQAADICSALAAMDCEVIRHPMLEIKALAETPAIKSQFMNIDSYDVVIVISSNAAEIGLSHMDQYWPLGQFNVSGPLGIDWVAIGPVTARVMREQGLDVKIPASRFDSESALIMPELENVAGKKVLIWRGVGGREKLASTLRERGAEVFYSELYERLVPDYDDQQWQQALAQQPLLMVSSGQGLEAIVSQQPRIADKIRGIIAPSQRVAELAESLGVTQIEMADSALDADMLAAVKRWQEKN